MGLRLRPSSGAAEVCAVGRRGEPAGDRRTRSAVLAVLVPGVSGRTVAVSLRAVVVLRVVLRIGVRAAVGPRRLRPVAELRDAAAALTGVTRPAWGSRRRR